MNFLALCGRVLISLMKHPLVGVHQRSVTSPGAHHR